MKKVWALVLSLLLTVAFFTGCGSSNNQGPKAKSNANADTQVVATKANTGTQVTATKATNKVSKVSSDGKANATINGQKVYIAANKTYNTKWEVAHYLRLYRKLPSNYITKKQAQQLGWKTKGTLDKVAPGKSIGGDKFGNYDKKLPVKSGRTYKECDIDYVSGNRGAKRIVYSSDGLIYYTGDHYKSFEKLLEGK